MSQEQDQKKRKEALKRLRAERKEKIAAASARMKQQKKVIKKIKEALKGGGKTVPEISKDTGIPTSEVLWYIAALRKYGQVAEGEQDGSYFRYELIQEAGESEAPGAEE